MINNPSLSHYLNKGPTEGILRIYNLRNDKSLLLQSKDIIEDSKNIRFQLDLGLFSNLSLQKDYREIGLELFAIEPLVFKKASQSLNSLLEKKLKEFKDKNIPLYN